MRGLLRFLHVPGVERRQVKFAESGRGMSLQGRKRGHGEDP